MSVLKATGVLVKNKDKDIDTLHKVEVLPVIVLCQKAKKVSTKFAYFFFCQKKVPFTTKTLTNTYIYLL